MSEHQHEWAEPRRTHVGWNTSCKSCTAWWSDPHGSPSGPPDWMTTTCSMTTVPEGVIYPADVPSDTIDSPPRLAGGGDVIARHHGCPLCAACAESFDGLLAQWPEPVEDDE